MCFQYLRKNKTGSTDEHTALGKILRSRVYLLRTSFLTPKRITTEEISQELRVAHISWKDDI